MTDRGSRLAGAQSIGRRERQEDAFAILESEHADADWALLVVADGMGGHAGGQEAAQCAVDRFVSVFGASKGKIPEKLQSALAAANAAVASLTREDPELEGAGCTLVAACVERDKLHWISVGDSSLLLIQNGQAAKLNDDHSMRPVLAEMVQMGRLTQAEAEAHANRNALRSAVTGDELQLVDRSESPLHLSDSDQVLLATDGLDVLSLNSVAEILEQNQANAANDSVQALLAQVENERATRQDNTTVLLFRPSKNRSYQRISRRPLLHRRGALVAIVFLALSVLGAVVIAPWHGQSSFRSTSLPRQSLRPSLSWPADSHGPNRPAQQRSSSSHTSSEPQEGSR